MTNLNILADRYAQIKAAADKAAAEKTAAEKTAAETAARRQGVKGTLRWVGSKMPFIRTNY